MPEIIIIGFFAAVVSIPIGIYIGRMLLDRNLEKLEREEKERRERKEKGPSMERKAVIALATKLGYHTEFYEYSREVGFYDREDGEISTMEKNIKGTNTDMEMLLEYLGLEVHEGKEIRKKKK